MFQKSKTPRIDNQSKDNVFKSKNLMRKLDHQSRKSIYHRCRSYILRSVPQREDLACSRWLRPIAHLVVHDDLWRFKRDAVARGVAIGLFWAFLVPVAQIPFSVMQCVFQRGMITASIIATFITNPFNFPFWWWLAYKVGNALMGGGLAYAPPSASLDWLDWALSIGKPTFLGMVIFALAFSAIGYFSVKLVWNFRVLHKRRTRRLQYRLIAEARNASAAS